MPSLMLGPTAVGTAIITSILIAVPAGHQIIRSLQLVWATKFDRDGVPDPANWTYERGFVRAQELQWYQPDNARVEQGLLIIEARREQVVNPSFDCLIVRLEAQPPGGAYHVGKPDHACPAQFHLRPLRDARTHRHAPGPLADFLDARRHGRVAAWRRNQHHGIIRGTLLANVAWGSRERWEPIWAATRTPLGVVRE